MARSKFENVANYVWSRDIFSYRKVVSASRGISTMWDHGKVMGKEILVKPHFLIVALVDNECNWIPFIVYALNSHDGRLHVWDGVSLFIGLHGNGKIFYGGEFTTPLYNLKELGGLDDYSERLYDLVDLWRRNDLLDITL